MFLIVMGSFLPLEGLEIECVKNPGPEVSRESPDFFWKGQISFIIIQSNIL